MSTALILVGKFSSGKSTCAKYVEGKYGIRVYEIGDYVRKSYHNSSNFCGKLIDYANYEFERGNFTTYVKEALEDSNEFTESILFSGIRTLEEMDIVKTIYSKVIVIAIKCLYTNRRMRYCKGLTDGVSFEDREKTEESWRAQCIDESSADYVIINDGSLSSFFKKIDYVFKSILEGDNEKWKEADVQLG